MRTAASRRSALLTALATCVTLAACGAAPDVDDAVAPPPADAASEDAAPQDPTLGGDRAQVAEPGDFPDAAVVPLRGMLHRSQRGCWTLDIAGTDRLVALPAGSAPSDDGAGWVLASGEVLASGAEVDVEGAVVPAGTVAGVLDGYWGNLLAFCASTPEFVVMASVAPAFDPASLSDAQWVDVLGTVEPSVDHGCGHGFASTSSDRRVAVQLTPADLPADRTAVTFPDPVWTATVTVGKDLLVDNCDDVLEQWETLPVLHATWPVVEGTLRFGGDGPLPSCTGGTVTAELTGAVVATPVGRVPLDDLALVNDAYGCFAG